MSFWTDLIKRKSPVKPDANRAVEVGMSSTQSTTTIRSLSDLFEGRSKSWTAEGSPQDILARIEAGKSTGFKENVI